MLAQAAMALNLFEGFRASASAHDDQAELERDRQRREGLMSTGPRDADGLMRIDLELQEEKQKQGRLPRDYLHQLPYMHARSFLYALDMTGKLLQQLTEMPGLPGSVSQGVEVFGENFPTLKGVRNSIQHLEDRIQGLGLKDRPLDLQPIDRGGFRIDGHPVVLDNLVGNQFGNTLADGGYGEVEISEASLIAATESVQRVLDSFTWTGPRRVWPQ
jgi:hypothetical protein